MCPLLLHHSVGRMPVQVPRSVPSSTDMFTQLPMELLIKIVTSFPGGEDAPLLVLNSQTARMCRSEDWWRLMCGWHGFGVYDPQRQTAWFNWEFNRLVASVEASSIECLSKQWFFFRRLTADR